MLQQRPASATVTSPATWASALGAGVYQVHLVVPEAPEDLLPFCPATGNLLVRLSGPTSSDTASDCMKP